MSKKERQSIKIYEDNDHFYDVFWQQIDRAKDLICITTYDMDHKNIAGVTLQKLRYASLRGVRVYLVIDDLNFYVNKQEIKALEEAGAIVIRNNPMKYFWKHLLSFRVSTFFQRNHSKVMLVDDNIFVGSLNIANEYSAVRYGDGNFRDLNIILQRQPTKKVRDFFRDILISNIAFYPEKLKENEIHEFFDEMDYKYKKLYDKFYKKQYSENPEVAAFIHETPPNKTEVTSAVLEMIQSAKKSIRIIQPYVQNVEELEDLLVEAMEKRGVEVEIITARLRDQAVYESFLNSHIFRYLMSHGAKVYEEPYKFLHMKVIEVDEGRFLTMGSLNQDHWSFYCNNEANILLVNQNPLSNIPSTGYNTFLEVWKRLKRECRPVDPQERYSTGGYIETMFWQGFLFCSYMVCRNRQPRVHP